MSMEFCQSIRYSLPRWQSYFEWLEHSQIIKIVAHAGLSEPKLVFYQVLAWQDSISGMHHVWCLSSNHSLCGMFEAISIQLYYCFAVDPIPPPHHSLLCRLSWSPTRKWRGQAEMNHVCIGVTVVNPSALLLVTLLFLLFVSFCCSRSC